MNTQADAYEKAMFRLWMNWVVSTAARILPITLSILLPMVTVPIITLTCMGLLMLYQHRFNRTEIASCMLIPSITIRSLGLSALLMIIISLIYSKGLITRYYEEELLNFQIPYLAVLIIAPCTLVLTVFALVRGFKWSACRNCRTLFGDYAERGFVGRLLNQERKVQMWFLLSITAVMTVTGFVYYSIEYVNVNLNDADRLIFVWVPVAFYILSCFFLAMRYFTLWAYYVQNTRGSMVRHGASTAVRYIILGKDDTFWLSNEPGSPDFPDSDILDTPASIMYPYREKLSMENARDLFERLTGLKEDQYTLRFMYRSEMTGTDTNILHYIVTLPDPDVVKNSSISQGEWYSFKRIDELKFEHRLSPKLMAEIVRLYTVTMAWKTYDADGKRLYRVKHYHPAFRLKGIENWDVDFDSPLWLNVSRYNQDKPFYRLRRFWQRRFTRS
ncbi:MAG: hypothetical protein K2K55_01945 [Duncaniella sp.]|nr:hypothetical protein [Duncaniella sp.]